MAVSQSISKTCPRCNQLLPVELFRLANGKRHGYCGPCEKVYKKEHYEKNKAEIYRKSVEWRANNPERYKESNRKYYEATKDRQKASWDKWRSENRDRRNAYTNEWRAANLERQREAEARYRARNRDACNDRVSDWKKRNLEKLRVYSAVRGRATRKARPAWANLDAIKALYLEAARMKRETGSDWHVDHIVPLIHPLVCGLHCEANLRIVPAAENIEKSNRWWPDMP